MEFAIFISLIIFIRIGELILSKYNETWLLKNNAIEFGSKHYPLVVTLHVAFFISLIIEYAILKPTTFSPIFVIIYLFLIALKAWIIVSLGRYWNTKIYRIPNMPLIKKGPYKFIKHPNYIIVIAEIAIIPLAFHLYITAISFSILNILMLAVRIKEENKALSS